MPYVETKNRKKTFNLPPWLIEMLDDEAKKFGEISVIASAAIYNLLVSPDADKALMIKNFRSAETDKAYDLSSEEAESIVAKALSKGEGDSTDDLVDAMYGKSGKGKKRGTK